MCSLPTQLQRGPQAGDVAGPVDRVAEHAEAVLARAREQAAHVGRAGDAVRDSSPTAPSRGRLRRRTRVGDVAQSASAGDGDDDQRRERRRHSLRARPGRGRAARTRPARRSRDRVFEKAEPEDARAASRRSRARRAKRPVVDREPARAARRGEHAEASDDDLAPIPEGHLAAVVHPRHVADRERVAGVGDTSPSRHTMSHAQACLAKTRRSTGPQPA